MFIPTVPTPDEMLDKSFSRAKKAANKVRTSKIPRYQMAKKTEEARIKTAFQVTRDTLNNLLDKTPQVDNMHMFYQDYIDVMVGVDELKKSLGALNWAAGLMTKLENEFVFKVRRSRPENAANVRKAAFGRISSILRQIGSELDFLDFVKGKLRNMPTIDFEAFTLVIAGFPNVGKTTVLRQITPAEPKVADYPFTTHGIQIGHFEKKWKKYQIIDTPGLLDRPIKEMNNIELRAMVALEHLADVILYIFDASETSGYPLDAQMRLHEEIEHVFETPIINVFNKMDLVENNKYLDKYISIVNEPLMISASKGSGVELIIDKLEEFNGRKKSY
ncbi:MAG: NOG1 family protein [Methanobacterium sp.]